MSVHLAFSLAMLCSFDRIGIGVSMPLFAVVEVELSKNAVLVCRRTEFSNKTLSQDLHTLNNIGVSLDAALDPDGSVARDAVRDAADTTCTGTSYAICARGSSSSLNSAGLYEEQQPEHTWQQCRVASHTDVGIKDLCMDASAPCMTPAQMHLNDMPTRANSNPGGEVSPRDDVYSAPEAFKDDASSIGTREVKSRDAHRASSERLPEHGTRAARGAGRGRETMRHRTDDGSSTISGKNIATHPSPPSIKIFRRYPPHRWCRWLPDLAIVS